MIRKILATGLLLPLLAGSLPAQTPDDALDAWLDSLWHLALEHRITVFDSLQQPMPVEELRHRFVAFDTVVNDQWTRPRCIDNVWHDGFDGVAVPKERPGLDTLPWRNDPGFVEFRNRVRDLEGNFLRNETAFLIPRSPEAVDSGLVRALFWKKIQADPALLAQYHQLCTTGASCWSGLDLEVPESIYIADSCQQLYRLCLLPGLQFKQDYAGTLNCFTEDMQPTTEVSVEGPADLFFEFAYRLQGYFIQHPDGLWTLEPGYLVFRTAYGVELHRFALLALKETNVLLGQGICRMRLERR